MRLQESYTLKLSERNYFRSQGPGGNFSKKNGTFVLDVT
eukprot:UN26464